MERSRRCRDDTEQQQQQSEMKSAGDERSETTARDDGPTEDDDEQAMGPAVTATDAEHTATGDEAAAPAAAAAGGGGGGTEAGGDVSVLDGVECKFNVNSYRMVFVVNTESFLYRRHALATAHRVSATCTRPGLELHNRLTAVDPGLPG